VSRGPAGKYDIKMRGKKEAKETVDRWPERDL
jgi:hypothetical protein